MRTDLKGDVFDAIHFLAADRIARRAAYQSIIIEELIKAGKQIIINGTDYRNDPEGKVTLGILGVVSEFERAKIIELMMRGKLHRLRKGEMIGGQAPYGYEHVCKTAARPATLAPKEPEATIVRTIFEKLDSGEPMAPGKRDQDPIRQDPLAAAADMIAARWVPVNAPGRTTRPPPGSPKVHDGPLLRHQRAQ